MEKPSIQTQRLKLRILTMEDAASFFDYRSLEDVARYQSFWPRALADAKAFIQAQAGIEPGTPGTWLQLAICHQGKLIGDIGIHFLDGDQLEVGYTLSPDFQGRGLAAEAVRGVIAEAFRQWGIHRVTASVDPRNIPSIRLLERLGFRKEGHFVKSYWTGAEWADDCVYALLEEEWHRSES